MFTDCDVKLSIFLGREYFAICYMSVEVMGIKEISRALDEPGFKQLLCGQLLAEYESLIGLGETNYIIQEAN